MIQRTDGSPKGMLWAYAYEVTLPEDEAHLKSVQALLDREQSEAKTDLRTWAAHMVAERQITRILVVSDHPERDRAINRSIERVLEALGATFVVTEPMAVSGDD